MSPQEQDRDFLKQHLQELEAGVRKAVLTQDSLNARSHGQHLDAAAEQQRLEAVTRSVDNFVLNSHSAAQLHEVALTLNSKLHQQPRLQTTAYHPQQPEAPNPAQPPNDDRSFFMDRTNPHNQERDLALIAKAKEDYKSKNNGQPMPEDKVGHFTVAYLDDLHNAAEVHKLRLELQQKEAGTHAASVQQPALRPPGVQSASVPSFRSSPKPYEQSSESDMRMSEYIQSRADAQSLTLLKESDPKARALNDMVSQIRADVLRRDPHYKTADHVDVYVKKDVAPTAEMAARLAGDHLSASEALIVSEGMLAKPDLLRAAIAAQYNRHLAELNPEPQGAGAHPKPSPTVKRNQAEVHPAITGGQEVHQSEVRTQPNPFGKDTAASPQVG